MARKPKKQTIIDALIRTGGILSGTAQILGVSRQAIYNWIEADPSLKAAREDAKESFIDMAESKLYKAVKEEQLVAVLFALKTQGKARGWIESQQIIFDKDAIIEVSYTDED